MSIVGTIDSGDQAVAWINSLDPKIQAAVRAEVKSATTELLRIVKEDKLSGQVLNVRTGNLRRSIAMRLTEDSDGITGEVNTNIAYGRMHEYGFSGTENVKMHLRNQTMAWGKRITPRQVLVSPFNRKVNFPARSFLRSALAEYADTFVADMKAAVAKASK